MIIAKNTILFLRTLIMNYKESGCGKDNNHNSNTKSFKMLIIKATFTLICVLSMLFSLRFFTKSESKIQLIDQSLLAFNFIFTMTVASKFYMNFLRSGYPRRYLQIALVIILFIHISIYAYVSSIWI